MSASLEVLLRGDVVADLIQAQKGALSLAYRPDARERIDAISLALPVRAEPFTDSECRGVLDWLLPEKQVRANIAQRIHADEADTFALLAHYGRECGGAVQFIEPGGTTEQPSITWLNEDELARRIDDLATNPFLSLDEDDIELSLGGVQEKALVVIENDRVGLPRHGAISTHIVKPDISDRIKSVLAEYFATRLAIALGVSAAHVSLRSIGSRLVLFVKRFDRFVDERGELRREHHETCAQALDIAPANKYQVRGGPGIGTIASLLRSDSADVVRDLQKLTQLVVYNTLIGNADAHIGNFGLMHYANGTTRLSPAYDLLPYEAVLGSPPKGYAMQLGGSYEFGNLTSERMEVLGTELGVAPRGVVTAWQRLGERLPDAARGLAETIANEHELSTADAELLDRIAADVTSRC